jgi:hypothetical protein
MDPSKKVRKPIAGATGVIVRGRPAREGDKTRAGVPVAVPSLTSAQFETMKPTGSARAPRQQTPPDTLSAVDERGTEGAAVLLSHLVSHLKRERERQSLSLTDLSKRSGLDRGMLCKLENQRISNPTFLTLWKYVTALDGRPAIIFLDAWRSATDAEVKGGDPR